MTFISKRIQEGFLHRRGFRGRWLTAYYHRYDGASEETERYHSHPWTLAVSIVLWGAFVDDVEKGAMRVRRPFSIALYRPSTRHRVLTPRSGTRSLFFGLCRQQNESRCATLRVPEGFAHYTEVA